MSASNPNNFSSLCKYPLLTREEEIQLGRVVRSMMDHSPPIPDELLKRGNAAKRRMIEGNIKLVIFVARKNMDRGIDLEDLISEGIIGLNRAVEKYDPAKGFRFSTYCYWWIRQSINRAIANHATVIRLPIHVSEKLNKMRIWIREYAEEHQKQPSRTEIEQYLNQELQISFAQYQELRMLRSKKLSLDAKLTQYDSELTLNDCLQDSHSDKPLSFLEARDELQAILRTADLTARETKVLALHYQYDLTLQEISFRLGGISRERVRQIKAKALKKCREAALRISNG